ncbi:hypothetical protein KKQ61_20405 [Pseudomonas aeruginosa]|nr:hypothetical protein [Pseudomonas aeruginosa]MDA3326492.1 hypothetical protein [Pseudomonas aeruginosa]
MKKILLLIPLAFAASLAWFVWLEPSPAPRRRPPGHRQHANRLKNASL